MALPGQYRKACGCLMAAFDAHSQCAHCPDTDMGSDACIFIQDYLHCNVVFTVDQQEQEATPS